MTHKLENLLTGLKLLHYFIINHSHLTKYNKSKANGFERQLSVANSPIKSAEKSLNSSYTIFNAIDGV